MDPGTLTGIVPLSFNPTLAHNFTSAQRQQDNPRFANDDDVRTEPSSPSASAVSSYPNIIAPEPPSTAATNTPLRFGSVSGASHKFVNSMRDYVNSPSYMNTGSIGNEFAFRASESSANGSPEKSPIRTSFAYRADEMQPYVNVQLSSNGMPMPNALERDKVTESPPEFTINYTTLDLDNPCFAADAGNSGTVVITAPVTPISKNFKSDFATLSPPRTPANHQSDEIITVTTLPGRSIPYVAIDFDKTVALSNSAATHRKEIMHHS
jgi:hypothetical protein